MDAPPPLTRDRSLFLDFDGTLVPLAPTPDGVHVSPALVALLETLAERLDGRVALVSGRSVAQLDHHLGPVARRLALSGSHGAEQRLAGETGAPAEPPRGLAAAADAFAAFVGDDDLVVVERKSLGVGLHFRQRPERGDAAVALARELSATYDLHLQPGKMMIELRAPGDKGSAIERLMAGTPFAGHAPVFLGDDVTDEDGFAAAARAGGYGVLVGDARESHARHVLADVDAVLGWLAAV